MATAAKKTTPRKKATKKVTASTPRKKATKKVTASTPRKKATATASVSRKKATTTNSPVGRATAQPTPKLHEREPAAILETAGYAATSLVTDVITLARDPERLERLEANLAALRDRLGKDLERTLATFSRVVDDRAAEGRKVVDDVVKDQRVSRVLDQTSNTRSQLRAALTSVTRTADVAGEAAGKQAETARTQVKGATTAVRRSTGQARSQVKGAATSVRKIADVAVDAASTQAPLARSQVKAAATSVRKSAETIAEAAGDTVADAEAKTAS